MRRIFCWLVAGIYLSAAAPWALGQWDGGAPTPDAQAAPDKDATRKKVDALIDSLKKDKAALTLGVVQECMDLSIDYGASSWNAGDHQACRDFYRQTAQSLVDAFGNGAPATAAAKASLADLKAALAHQKDSNDVDKNAWALRYAFDKAQLSCEDQFAHMAGLLSLGSDYLARKDVDDAQDAFNQALAMLPEMKGRDPAKLPLVWRVAPILAANALVMQKKYKQGAAAIAAGVEAVPEWARARTDLREAMGGPDAFAAMIDDLKTAAQKDPQDAGLQFLLGYELNFGGDHDGALIFFRAAVELDPKMKAAQIFIDAPAPPPLPAPPIDPRRVG